MAKYKIKHTSIMHNGNLYAEGSTVELTKEQAERLVDFVTLVPEKKNPQTDNKNKNQNTNKNTANKNAGEKKDGENNDNN